MCYTFNDNKTLRHPRETGAKEWQRYRIPSPIYLQSYKKSPPLPNPWRGIFTPITQKTQSVQKGYLDNV